MTYFYRYDNGTVTYYLPEHEARRRYNALDHQAANLIGTFEQGFTYYLQAHGRVVQVHARPITADRVPELVRLQLAADFPPPPPAPAYEVRYTWESLTTTPHPRFTSERFRSETTAIDAAVAAVERMEGNTELRLVAVHWRHVDSVEWAKVE
jgi:hypothetical protein